MQVKDFSIIRKVHSKFRHSKNHTIFGNEKILYTPTTQINNKNSLQI